ncbi:hypothetical protein FGIG_08350 [Fasciola gigantica]|uniref:Uncharacterized protein n=1 Tax=Fasciola gigantica TaxID=46835 RepID=A0A504YZP7_FASGI|nr:hypothetical protein FGIG_08350 [Fasciola gigantica]
MLSSTSQHFLTPLKATSFEEEEAPCNLNREASGEICYNFASEEFGQCLSTATSNKLRMTQCGSSTQSRSPRADYGQKDAFLHVAEDGGGESAEFGDSRVLDAIIWTTHHGVNREVRSLCLLEDR